MIVNAGIDVSKWQRGIDWERVARGGPSGETCHFAIIKASEGKTSKDPMLETNWHGAGSVGIRRGLYHFARWAEVPEKEANNLLRRMEAIWDGSEPMMPFLDAEWGQGEYVPEPGHAADFMYRFIDRVQTQTGHGCGIYTNASFWAQIGNPLGFGTLPLWVARYQKNWQGRRPPIPAGWDECDIWQYRGDAFPQYGIPAGTWPGVTPPASAVDLNHFFGTVADIEEMAAAGPYDIAAVQPTVDKANFVLVAQMRLNQLGFKGANGNRLVEDGIMGRQTHHAIGAYQVSRGLRKTGVLDSETLPRLLLTNE